MKKAPLEKRVTSSTQADAAQSVSAQHPDNPFKADKEAINPFLPISRDNNQIHTAQMKSKEEEISSSGVEDVSNTNEELNTSVERITEAKVNKPAASMAETMAAKLQTFDRRLNKPTNELRHHLMSQYKITDENDPSIASALKIHEAYIKDKNDGDTVSSTVADSIA